MKHLQLRRLAKLSAALLLALSPSMNPCADDSKEQMDFGVKAAKRGLWREARFRWEKALKLSPQNSRLLNNLAVACETDGDFKKAEELYRAALQIDPGNRDIKQNYELFTSYYKQIQSRQIQQKDSSKESPPTEKEPSERPPPRDDDAPPPR
ncbi:MAG TPA: tetratricopeptide repeat protein [Candidatus Polarisedimenticolia bacterium]|jgi:Flp pilus assembly protein TadD|nr:tetratricopeptide repeat protein [Candidatus Polarisedimenticolia bacterium]